MGEEISARQKRLEEAKAIEAAKPQSQPCAKCGGKGRYPFEDSRKFVAFAACECVGGGPVKKKE